MENVRKCGNVENVEKCGKMWKNVETPTVHLSPVCGIDVGYLFYFWVGNNIPTKINDYITDATCGNVECGKCGNVEINVHVLKMWKCEMWKM